MEKSQAVWQLKKIKSKYIIIEVFAFAGHLEKIFDLLWRSSRLMRALFNTNTRIFLSIFSANKWIETQSEILKTEGTKRFRTGLFVRKSIT